MRPTRNIGRLAWNLVITVKSKMAATSSRLFKGSPALTKWNLLRVLAVGVMLSVGMAMYFNMVPEGMADAPTTVQNLEATASDNSARYLRRLNNDDEWRFDSPYIEDFRPDSMRPLSKEVLAEYQRDDDEWLYHSPFRRNWDDFSVGQTASPLSIDPAAEIGGRPAAYPGDDEWMYGPPYIQIFLQP